MSLILSSIDGGVNEQNSIMNGVHVDVWTAERAIITGNAQMLNKLPGNLIFAHHNLLL